MLVTTVGSFLASKHLNQWGYRRQEEEAAYAKQLSYIRISAESVTLAKDIRVFGLGGWLKEIYQSVEKRYEAFVRRREMAGFLANVIEAVLALLRDVWVSDWDGFHTPAFRGGIFAVCDGGQRFYSMDLFRHLNLTIRAGEKLAVVGLNGAGKTTLVKLLCGFYDPEEGRVLLNGTDIRLFNRREYYRLFSASGSRRGGVSCDIQPSRLSAWNGSCPRAGYAALAGHSSRLIQVVGMMQSNMPFLQTTYEFLDIPNHMYQGSLTTEKRSDRQYEVEFRDVSFHYPGAESWACGTAG